MTVEAEKQSAWGSVGWFFMGAMVGMIVTLAFVVVLLIVGCGRRK